MVKSNKFDYTGRTSSGPKLGKSIAADLEKRADKKQRDSLKTAAKQTFKSHFPASRSKRDKDKPREPDVDKDGREDTKHDLHKLDLKVPGKALGDEGFALLCDGLQNALSSCADLALIDFNATNNSLSTRSLARLAPVIRQSKFNLQTLDLSNNDFQVTNATEAREWECFLCAFHDCMTLRRVDISDNPSLGPWAMEILARVYSREPLVDPLPATGAQSLITLPEDASLSDDDIEDQLEDEAQDDDGDELPRCANGKTLADTWELGYRRGLRSLPYLTLANIGLTDTGALFLSYILEQHHYPTQLITEVNAAEATNQAKAYRQDANSKGIDWDDNSGTLGKEGLHLLQCAERQRAKTVLGDVDSFTSSAYDHIRHSELDVNVSKKYHPANRRASLRSVHSLEYSIYDKSDIDSARKKIQRNTIIQAGCRSVELWQSALKAIAYSRMVCMIAPKRRDPPSVTDIPSEESGDRTMSQHGSEVDMRSSRTSLGSYEDVRDSWYCQPPKQNLAPIEELHQSKRTYAATLMKTSVRKADEPVLAITKVTSSPVVPVVQSGLRFVSPQEKDRGATRANSQASSGTPDHLIGAIQCDDRKSPFAEYQRERMEALQIKQGGQSDGYRDMSLLCQLPLPVCIQILGHAMNPNDINILKPQQQRTAFAWGQKKETLRIELEWRRKDESSQLLMYLSGAECVDY